MKTKLTRTLGMLLAVVLVFSLISASASRKALAAGESEASWSVTFTDFDLSSFNIASAFAFGYTDQGVYCSATETVSKNIPEGAVVEYEGQYDVYAPALLFLSYDGEAQKLINYIPFSMEREHSDKYNYDFQCYQQGIKLLPDGTFAELAVFGENWCTVPDLISGEDAYWENFKSSQEYYLRHLSADGTELSCSLIPTLEDEYIGTFSADDEGNVICAMSGKLLSINPVDGSLNWAQSFDFYPDRILTIPNAGLAFTAWVDYGVSLYPVNARTGETGDPLAIPSDAYSLFSGGGDYPLYYSNGASLIGTEPGTAEKNVIFNWINLDIAVEVYGDLCVTEDGTVIGMVDKWAGIDVPANGENNCQYRLFRVSRTENAGSQKTVLTLATPWLDYDKRADVLRFNTANEEYHIDILDYSVYNTDEEWYGGARKLEEDILRGAVKPDLVDLVSLNIEKLAANGILEDLYPYLDASEAYSRDDFFPSVLAAAEIEGKLYYPVRGFCVNTLIGESAVVGENPGWTYRDYRNALASKPGTRPMSIYTTAGDVFRSCFSIDFARYIDLASNTCSFENGDFLDLLTFAASFPTEYTWEGYNYETDCDQVSIAAGRQLLYSAYIASAGDAIYYGASFNGKPYTYIGYPVNSGTGSSLSFEPGIAMCASSENKETAWQFLSLYFLEERQKDQYLLPANKNAFYAKLDEMMQISYATDVDGNPILDDAGQPIPQARAYVEDGTGYNIEIYAMTQQDADRLLQLVETTTRREYNKDGLNSLVEEQAEAFFRGEQSAEETARRAQEAVTAFLQN
ncbi:MAG: hypothetical protein IJG40_16265 [Oscillospiraceae bacterium]|nr:hypothetical protein [Oscillospiraceae bacterium]